jgi:hypothetical protein
MLPLRRSHFAIAEVCEVEDSVVVCSVLAFPAPVSLLLLLMLYLLSLHTSSTSSLVFLIST